MKPVLPSLNESETLGIRANSSDRPSLKKVGEAAQRKDHSSMSLQEAFQCLRNAGYQDRPDQVRLMELVEKTVRQSSVAVIEGGTGIGKTFGYLIPTLLNRPKDVHVVIATATINLQNQLVQVDIPHLSKILGLPLNAEIAKGRRRYVCVSRLYHHQRSQGELSLYGIEKQNQSSLERQQQVQHLIDEFESERWNGDRDELSTPVESALWQQVTTDAVGCNNKRCEFFSNCPYFKTKRALAQADLIVTNHDLLLSDLAMGSGVVLPKMDKTLYVIDEAHHFPHKAVDHSVTSVPLRSAEDWLDQMAKGAIAVYGVLSDSPQTIERFSERCELIKSNLSELARAVTLQMPEEWKDEFWLVENPTVFQTLTLSLSQSSATLKKEWVEARDRLTQRFDVNTLPQFEETLTAIGYHLHHAEVMAKTFSLFSQVDVPNEPPIARWVTRSKDVHKSGELQWICHAAMISAAPFLVPYFFEQRKQAVILCSATLRSLGSFQRFLEDTGLEHYPEVVTQAFPSPFDYSRSQLVIPPMKHLPKGDSADAHTEEVCQVLKHLLDKETQGTLVLFMSQRVMDLAFAGLPSELKKKVAKQGDQPKHVLIERHKKAIDDGQKSIIFGLQSFAEGIDLPGNYCRHVILTKLPFAVPSTPLERTWVKWLEAQGKNGFMDHALPYAALRLTQYVGRLIRTEKDTGTVTILDRRLVTQFYGRKLIQSLPEFKVITT